MKRIPLLLALLLSNISLWAQNDFKLSELALPMAEFVSPGLNQSPPPSSVSLFTGTKLDAWDGKTADWTVQKGVLTNQPGAEALTTRQSFADCQLHLEWLPPANSTGKTTESGHSGILLQGRYEVPLLSPEPSTPENNPTPTSEWQSCDILFRAPRFNPDGSIKSSAALTVLHPDFLTQDHLELPEPPADQNKSAAEQHLLRQALVIRALPAALSFRNIWIREIGVQQLLNGKNLTGWYSYLEKLGKNNDPEGNFKIVDGVLHTEGKNFGYVATEKSYANYYLKVVFKWGQKQYAPRATGKRDSGILYHFGLDLPDKVWPKSLECQVQEGDCGDTWCVDGASIESANHSAIEWNMKRIYRTADFEHPNSEWNTIEIVCNGDQVEHFVNGHLVNTGTKASVTSGKILLQSEGAEISFRSVELIPL